MMRATTVVMLAAALTGCAGASSDVVAPGAKVPISLSRAVRDADGVVVPQERQEIVGHFEQKSTSWGIAWSLVDLTPRTDLSQNVNQQVARAKGDAVVRLAVRSKPCGMNFVPVLGWLPIWPGCSSLVIGGDIVRVKPAPAPPPPVVAPTMPEPTPPVVVVAVKPSKKVSKR